MPRIAWVAVLAIGAVFSGTLVVAQEAPTAPVPPQAETPTVAPDPNRVYARIDGEPITEADLDVAALEYMDELSRMPEQMRVAQLLNVVIDMRLLAKAAETAGMDDKESVQRQMAFDRSKALRNEYLRDKSKTAVTDDNVRARFDEELAKFEPADELHLRHILVDDEDAAKGIISDLDQGGDFAAIAKEKSLDPGSAQRGGDLGFVTKGKTVPEFEKAAFELEVGNYTKEPVQSQFGWHVIKLDEKRKQPPPEFAAEESRIRNELVREFVSNEVESLRAAANIEIVPPPTPPAAGEGATPPAGGETAPSEGGAETPSPQ